MIEGISGVDMLVYVDNILFFSFFFFKQYNFVIAKYIIRGVANAVYSAFRNRKTSIVVDDRYLTPKNDN